METPAEYRTVSYPPKDADQYEDASNDHAYFAMMPNMLDDMLDPYQYRLYAHIKRVCGEKGKCWQSTETIAKACRMSAGKVSECKRELARMGLVSITEKQRKHARPYHIIRIVDIWNRNIIHCSQPPCSPDEQPSSPGEGKKTPLEKDPREGATAPCAPADDSPDDSWPDDVAPVEEEAPPPNPAQERLERMRSKFGDDPVSVGAHCQQAQEVEGEWTVPVHYGLSAQCAVFKEATNYRPGKAQRTVINETIPDNDEALHMWFRVCQGWMLTYDNHKNVAGMLDWYAEGRVGRDKPEGRKNGGPSTGRNRSASVEPRISASTVTFGVSNV